MRTTKVKALSVGGRRKIYYSGDTVSEDMFPKGEFDNLIKKGFLFDPDKDDGKKPNFDDDDQPEARYNENIQRTPQPQMAPFINPALAAMPPLKSEPSEPKESTEPPVVPGTPNVESAKPKTLKAEEAQTDLNLVPSTEKTEGQTEGEKKGTLKDQGYLDAQKTTDEKIADVVKDAEGKGSGATTNFDQLKANVEKRDAEKAVKPEGAPGAITNAQMKKDLDARGVKYAADIKRPELFKLWASGV